MRFKPAYEYIYKFWENNEDAERNWVPWDWCETVKSQTSNNSIVIFAPSHPTLHAVKASYDHLAFQRTQIYGNLWFDECFQAPGRSPGWGDLEVGNSGINAKRSFQWRVANLSARFKNMLRGGASSDIDHSRKGHY